MNAKISNPLWRPCAWLIVGLLFSIGWGIRGNYGHETGAMLPGAMGAMAVSLLSRRDDWQRRVVYFGLFGMLGWAFGGSISYMMVIGYTHSGDVTNQWYGYLMLFVIGFLWAGLGGAGTALPAVLDEPTLKAMFRPLMYVIAAWAVLYVGLDPVTDWIDAHWLGTTSFEHVARQERPLYWLDTDWLSVTAVMVALIVCYFVEQRGAGLTRLVAYMAVGGLTVYGLAWGTDRIWGNVYLASKLWQWQGAGTGFYADDQLAVANWPSLFSILGRRTGVFYQGDILSLWGGAKLGAIIYAFRHVRLAFPLRLMVWMVLGWWIGFLTLPVIGSLFCGPYGGFRMTPPRGDNWAGVLGLLVAALIVCWRAGYRPIVVAALVCGTVGGIGFSGSAWLEAALESPGNPVHYVSRDVWRTWHDSSIDAANAELTYPPELAAVQSPNADPETVATVSKWSHWQNQNWHSFLEQTYGLINGWAVLLAMATLVRDTPTRKDESPFPNWRHDLALVMVLPVLTFVNMIKNVNEWVTPERPSPIPAEMIMPWFRVTLSARVWFGLFYAAATLAFVVVLAMRRRRDLACLPASVAGRGLWLLLSLLWIFVGGNFARALPTFTAPRLLTEGVIYLNALAATVLLVGCVPATTESIADERTQTIRWTRRLVLALGLLIMATSVVPVGQTWALRRLYGDAPTAKRGFNYRWGPRANWMLKPALRGQAHR